MSNAPKLRTSRGIRARLKAKTKTPREARTVALDKHGLVLEGQRFPYYIGTDVDVQHMGDSALLVHVGIFAKTFDMPDRLPRGATVTIRQE